MKHLPTKPERFDSSSPGKLLEALTSVSQGVLVFGPDRRLLSCNDAFTVLTGLSTSDIAGRSLDVVRGPNSDAKTFAAVADALRSGKIFTGEVLNYKKDGTAFWNDLTVLPVHDPAGRLASSIGIVRDVTERKNAEDALIASVERQVFLLDRIHAGIVIHAMTTEVIYANAAATQLLGISADEILGIRDTDPRLEFTREDGTPMPIEEYPVNRTIAAGCSVNNLVVGLRRGANGSVVWAMCNAFPVFDAHGIASEIVVSITDVTELKLAERALQRSDERLRLVLQGSNDAPWDWDVLAGRMYYSPRWWQMVGFEVDETPGDPELWQQLMHADDRDRAVREFELALGDENTTSYELEFRLRCKDGSYVPVLSRGFILRDAGGRAIRVSGTNTDLTERKRTEARINQLAYYDALTSLPNRRLLMEQLHKALLASSRSGRQGALLFIDLDNFKVLNDTLGHDVGDQLLAQVARRLRACVREVDTVARLGGDEFVVMLENLPRDSRAAAVEAEQIGKKILAALDAPYVLAEREHVSTASIGIALFDHRAQGVDGLLKQADLAMYQAKAMGRNTLRNFDVSMQTAVDERSALENDLRKGLQLGEMMLYYQPQVVESGDVVGAEVLLRWQHSVRGMVYPAAFIPLAESTGLILPLGNWVLRRACEQLAAWAADPVMSRLSLSVNVSVRQFREPDFAAGVLAMIDDTGADPRKLKLEMTESLLAENIDDIIGKMGRLKERGIAFSLDDFGTGYSSLRYLQRLPLSELKIDRTFVVELLSNPNDCTIARAIITLAENLGLGVIAEGVETNAQRRFLSANGCRAYQGYLFGKPFPLATFEAATRAAALPGITAVCQSLLGDEAQNSGTFG